MTSKIEISNTSKPGAQGFQGFTPVLVYVPDNNRLVVQLQSFSGSFGALPLELQNLVGKYQKSDGTWTSVISEAFDINSGSAAARLSAENARDDSNNILIENQEIGIQIQDLFNQFGVKFLNGKGFAVVDSIGNILYIVNENGNMLLKSMKIDSIESNFLNFNDTQIKSLNLTSNCFAIADETGNIVAKIALNGDTALGNVSVKSLLVNGLNIDVASYATQANLAEINSKLKDRNVFDVIDDIGNRLFYVDETGTLKIRSINVDTLAVQNTTTFSNLIVGNHSIKSIFSVNFSWAVCDEAGNIAIATKKDGSLVTKLASQKDKRVFGFMSDINHFSVYGQSLSVGAYGTPPIHTAGVANVLGFNKGPVMRNYDNDSTKYDSLVQLIEIGDETACSGFGRMMKQVINAENFSTASNQFDMLLSAPGNSGETIEQLSRGTTHYNRLLAGVTNGLRLANAAGKTYNFGGVFWMQGEQNTNDPYAYYKERLKILVAQLNQDIIAITGQKNPVAVLTYQTACHNVINGGAGVYPNTALAQFDASFEDNNVYMGVPMYQYDYAADNVHLANATQYSRLGALAGYIMKKIVTDGIDFKPIYPIKSFIQNNIVEVVFNVPKSPLFLDTSIVSDPGNFGFRIFNGTTEVTINSVTVVRPDTVRIVANANLSSGMTITYGVNGTLGKSGRAEGSRGCLRDSQGLDAVFEGYALHNYCPIQKFNI